ncbi:aconitase family protein [Shigella flexneri]
MQKATVIAVRWSVVFRAWKNGWRIPQLLEADADAEYAAVIEINLADMKEPILCAPNDPDDARLLSDVQGDKIDEVFIGSCMTNIGHFRLPVSCWIPQRPAADPSVGCAANPYGCGAADRRGLLQRVGRAGAYRNPGCSLCMGKQARVADGATVVSTSTRNFPNRLGTGANVFLASAELAAVAALIGKLPTPEDARPLWLGW